MKRVLVLFILLLLTHDLLFSVDLNEMIVYKQAVYRPDQIIGQKHRDVMNKVCAGLLITSDLTGLTFQSNNGVVGLDSNPGRYMVYVSEGERVLDVYKDGFKPLEIILSDYGVVGLKSGQVYELQVTSKVKDINAVGTLMLNTNPQGADITVFGSPEIKFKTPYTFKDYSVKPYRFTLKKEHYLDMDTTLFIDKDTAITKTVNLIPDWTDVSITTDPLKCIIYVNNNAAGLTPYSRQGVDEGYKHGKYILKIAPAHPFYPTIIDTVEFIPGVPFKKHYQLKNISGVISISQSDTKYKVYLNDVLSSDLSSKNTLRLISGSYRLSIIPDSPDASFFKKWENTVKLNAGDSVVVIPDFSTGYSNLILKTEFKDLDVKLNNIKHDGLSKIKEGKVYHGIYSLEVAVSNNKRNAYKTFKSVIDAKADEKMEINVSFEPIRGLLKMASNKDNLALFIRDIDLNDNFKPYFTDSLLIGQYEIKAELQGYLSQTKKIEIKPERTTEIYFEMKTYQGSLQEIADMWNNQSKVSQYSAWGTLLASGIAFSLSEYSYSNYKKSKTNSDAIHYRDKVNLWKDVCRISLSTSVISGFWSVYTKYKSNKIKTKMSNVKE